MVSQNIRFADLFTVDEVSGIFKLVLVDLGDVESISIEDIVIFFRKNLEKFLFRSAKEAIDSSL